MSPTESSSQCGSPQCTQRQPRYFLDSCSATPCSYLSPGTGTMSQGGSEHCWLCSSDTQACKIQQCRRKPEQHMSPHTKPKSRQLCWRSPWQHSFTKITLSWSTGKQSPYILIQSPMKLRFCVLAWGFIFVLTTTLPVNYLEREGCSSRNQGKIQCIVWDTSVLTSL